MAANAGGKRHRATLGAAANGLMDEPLLPRRGLTVGAVGAGAAGRRYRLLAPIDRGGMGELFLAEVTEPERPSVYVVLKRLLADLLDDDKYVSMFRSEAEVMSQLDHKNIVRVFDTPIIDEAPCLAMEFIRGRNVQQILQRHDELGTKMPPAIVLRIMAEVLTGLAYAHDYRLPDGTPLALVHRDVTPGNVLVSFDGDVKLTDFGIAKSQMSAVSTTVGIVKGKARYLSPEQILGEPATPRSDIFSAASVICEMLTGLPTFDRASVPKTLYAIVNGNRDDLQDQLAFRAPLLVQTIDRALASAPKDRIQSATELRDGLEAASHLLEGNRVERADLGAYLSDLFRDVEDPLANYERAPAGIASPGGMPKPTDAEVPTVHGYRAVPPPLEDPVAGSAPSNQKFRPTELIRRAGHPPPPPAEMDDDPSVPSAEALAIAAASAHGAGPTQIVRGRPIDPLPENTPSDPNASVDEALSVLAWLQSKQTEDTKVPPPPLDRPTPSASNPSELDLGSMLQDEPLPNLRSTKGPLIGVFFGGLLAGVLLTVVTQVFVGDDEPSPPAKETSAAIEPTTEATTTTKKAPVEAATEEAVEAPVAPPTPPPEPSRVEPIELVAPPPEPVRPTLLDVLYPRGARVKVDGRVLKKRVPIYGLELDPGEHVVRVYKKNYRKAVSIETEGNEKFELTKRLRKK